VGARAKCFEFAVTLDRRGELGSPDAGALTTPEGWTPEHLVLGALARCSLTSLRYHAERAGLDVTADAQVEGVVTKREEDGRYAFVEIECRIDADIDPVAPDALGELLAKAERDCFIGASLTPSPRYVWRVNGEARATSSASARNQRSRSS
jgi:uncharacterized OsmC-like protein